MDKGEGMIVAALDQDWEECVRVYDRLTPIERGELAKWMVGDRGDLRHAPLLIREQVLGFAQVAFLETGLRWAQRSAKE